MLCNYFRYVSFNIYFENVQKMFTQLQISTPNELNND